MCSGDQTQALVLEGHTYCHLSHLPLPPRLYLLSVPTSETAQALRSAELIPDSGKLALYLQLGSPGQVPTILSYNVAPGMASTASSHAQPLQTSTEDPQMHKDPRKKELLLAGHQSDTLFGAHRQEASREPIGPDRRGLGTLCGDACSRSFLSLAEASLCMRSACEGPALLIKTCKWNLGI